MMMPCAGCGCEIKLLDKKGLPAFRKSTFGHSFMDEQVHEGYCGSICAKQVCDRSAPKRKEKRK